LLLAIISTIATRTYKKEGKKMDKMTIEQFLRKRGVETPCEKCHGFGTIRYGSGSTFRRGMGVTFPAWDTW
jgi:hypothetical protein